MSKKTDFLADVLHEINMLKQHAFKTELKHLNLKWFDFNEPTDCIYGQLTGNCTSNRARKLMSLSCIRVMDVKDGTGSIANRTIRSKEFNVNGVYTGQTWKKGNIQYGFGHRSYKYLSALEGYICTKGAKIEAIMQYMKGETDTLTL